MAKLRIKNCKSAITIEERAAIFKKATGTRKSVRTVFVTPWGLKENAYSGRVQRQVTAKDLFK